MAPTKQRIVDIAVELFNRSGSAAISTNHIARASNISPGNLYYHFRNKQQILLAAAERFERAAAAAWEQPVPTLSDREAAFDRLSRYAEVLRRHVFLVREVFALQVEHPEVGQRLLDRRARDIAQLGLLPAHLAAGGAAARSPTRPETLGELLWAALWARIGAAAAAPQVPVTAEVLELAEWLGTCA